MEVGSLVHQGTVVGRSVDLGMKCYREGCYRIATWCSGRERGLIREEDGLSEFLVQEEASRRAGSSLAEKAREVFRPSSRASLVQPGRTMTSAL